MAFTPKSNRPETDPADRKPFVTITPEDGLQPVHVGLLVNLGMHKKLPKFAKDSNGKREQDEDGNDKILFPKEGKDLEQRVGVYVDLLTQTHDYEGDIGVKNIRLPLHQVMRGVSEGVNFVTVAPRTPDGEYIKGKPWSLASTSIWKKIADSAKDESGNKLSDKIFKADYKNPNHNNIDLLLGKPFMYNVEVTETTKEDNKYVNVKLKSPVPLMKGMNAPEALIPAISIGFDDEDLLEVKEELGNVAKFDLIRLADLRKIVLADDYAGTKMQEAIQERMDEKELIEKAKEIHQKNIENDKDLNEIKDKHPEAFGGSVKPAKSVEKKVESKKPAVVEEEDLSEAPF
jgi:hypothetical protein